MLALLSNCFATNGQNLDSLFEAGQNDAITHLYERTTSAFDNNQLEIVAAAYDKLGRLPEEDQLLSKIISSFPLFLTYSIPANYLYYGNLINAELMEKHKTSITGQYLKSIKDTSLGREILKAFYNDQTVRLKFDYNKYCKEHDIKIKWDDAKLMSEWVKTDSFDAILIARIIQDNGSFPGKMKIGMIGTYSLFIMMQHLSVNSREYYDHYLFDAACKKDIGMVDYAMYKTMTLVRTHQIPDSLFQNTLDSLSELRCR